MASTTTKILTWHFRASFFVSFPYQSLSDITLRRRRRRRQDWQRGRISRGLTLVFFSSIKYLTLCNSGNGESGAGEGAWKKTPERKKPDKQNCERGGGKGALKKWRRAEGKLERGRRLLNWTIVTVNLCIAYAHVFEHFVCQTQTNIDLKG